MSRDTPFVVDRCVQPSSISVGTGGFRGGPLLVAEGWSLTRGGATCQVVPYSWRNYPVGGPLLVAGTPSSGPLFLAADNYRSSPPLESGGGGHSFHRVPSSREELSRRWRHGGSTRRRGLRRGMKRCATSWRAQVEFTHNDHTPLISEVVGVSTSTERPWSEAVWCQRS